MTRPSKMLDLTRIGSLILYVLIRSFWRIFQYVLFEIEIINWFPSVLFLSSPSISNNMTNSEKFVKTFKSSQYRIELANL